MVAGADHDPGDFRIALLHEGHHRAVADPAGHARRYLAALILGGTSAAGRDLGFAHIAGRETSMAYRLRGSANDFRIAIVDNWDAISLIATVASCSWRENTGNSRRSLG